MVASSRVRARRAQRPSLSMQARARVREFQRARLLAAAICVIDERGYPDATVGDILARARISRAAFYEQFSSREDCLLGVLTHVTEQVRARLVDADLGRREWCERLRAGLWIILSHFDREPAAARVCVIETLRAGPNAIERRSELLGHLSAIVDSGRNGSERTEACPPLTADGLVGAMWTILYSRLHSQRDEPVLPLLGELMSIVVLPYLGASAALRERTRPAPRDMYRTTGVRTERRAPLDGGAVRLTYRTACVLEALRDHPGASNRAVGEQAEISDQGQVSKLLARLERLKLITNSAQSETGGQINAWSLTGTGEQLIRAACRNDLYPNKRAAS